MDHAILTYRFFNIKILWTVSSSYRKLQECNTSHNWISNITFPRMLLKKKLRNKITWWQVPSDWPMHYVSPQDINIKDHREIRGQFLYLLPNIQRQSFYEDRLESTRFPVCKSSMAHQPRPCGHSPVLYVVLNIHRFPLEVSSPFYVCLCFCFRLDSISIALQLVIVSLRIDTSWRHGNFITDIDLL